MSSVVVPKKLYNELLSRHDARLHECGTLEQKLRFALLQNDALIIKIIGKKMILSLEEQIMPGWLQLDEMPNYQKWVISLFMELTPKAKVIVDKLNEITKPMHVGLILSHLWDEWLKLDCKSDFNSPKNDFEWDTVFYYLSVYNEQYKKIIKIVINNYYDFSIKDSSHQELQECDKKTKKHFIKIINVDVTATPKQIEKFFESVEVTFIHIEWLCETSSLPSFERSNCIVFILFDNFLSKFLKALPSASKNFCSSNKKLEIVWQHSMMNNEYSY